MQSNRRNLLMAILLTICAPVSAGEADITSAQITQQGDVFNVQATIKSNDTGWSYYADRFEVSTLDGELLGTRVLLHPHETEQPFTRSLRGLEIPAGIKTVLVRARMKPGGASGDTIELAVPGR